MSAPLRRPQAIIFDWDNTLVDSWALIQAAMNVTLTAMGHAPWDMDETKRRVAHSAKNAFPALFADRWEEARDIFYHEYEAQHLERLTPLPGTAAMVEELYNRGLYLAVVSNKQGRLLREEAARLGWDRWFRRLVGATDAAHDKPSPAPVHLALEEIASIGEAPIWFVGDAEIDMECARNSGCIPVLLRAESRRSGEFSRFAPEIHFSRCDALLTALSESAVP